MKIKSVVLLAPLISILLLIAGCFAQENHSVTLNGKYTECKNKTILTTLDDEPAYIQKGCYNFLGKIDSFTIILLKQPNIGYYVDGVYPTEGVPQGFRKDRLHVLISGNILNCKKWNNCTPPVPNAGYQRINMLELKSIKINERGECSICDDTTVVAVLEDEPAYLRKGCFEESDLFYIDLVNVPVSNNYVSKLIYPCNGIPEKFQIDGLSVLITGNILRCGKGDTCIPSMPNVRVAPINIFELKTIKTTVK